MKLTARNTHRDIAYFFVGLIISFSLSGIFLNHRQSWHPRRYVYESKEITIPMVHKDSINEAYIKNFTSANSIEGDMRRFNVEGDKLKISYTANDVVIDLTSGRGKIESYRTTPVLGQMTKLHQDTSKWWIYYSDIFGIGMIVIACTGMFIQEGSNSFRARGWKLALVGIIFPLIFLFLLA